MSDHPIKKCIHKFDMSIMENKMCYLILLYNYEYLEYDKSYYIKRKDGISRINNKQLGKLLGSYLKHKQKYHIYCNNVSIGIKKPLQIIALPREKINMNIYVPVLNSSISSNMLYKYILNNS